MSNFQDLFSAQAADYARYRPRYPAALFGYVAGLAPRRDRAWDVATGNGQAAVGLAEHFAHVVATDGSAAQLRHAQPHERITYREELAEATTHAARSVDLVTVAQALHWFRVDAFYDEIRRVLRPDGILAVWCYSLCEVTPEVDRVVDWFYHEVTGPYWEPGRRWVDERYATVPFPFDEIRPTPRFDCEAEWTLADLVGYLRSWSAVQGFRRQRGADPMPQAAGKLAAAWGEPEFTRRVRWPIHLRIGRLGG